MVLSPLNVSVEFPNVSVFQRGGGDVEPDQV